MSDQERKFHEEWLGLAQPIDGLVVSVPVLTEAGAMERKPPSFQEAFLKHVPEELVSARSKQRNGPRTLTKLEPFLQEILGWTPDLYDIGSAIPEDLSLFVPEGGQTLRPTLALRKLQAPEKPTGDTPASLAGDRYVALVWEVPKEVDLDRPETLTGPWSYPATAKFDRLLRACRVSIGLVTNRRAIRLVYAPHGESSGSITFRLDDLATVGGRPLLDALVMLLSAFRFFGAATEHQLPALLRASRDRQANVTNELADQVFDALNILLRGFEGASERDGRRLLDDALARGEDEVYGGLLTVLLRLVFILYAEDQGLLPIDQPFYAKNMSLLGLHAELQSDAGRFPDSMNRRFGAYGRLVALWRSIFFGARHGTLRLPAREGDLFSPHRYPFLEGNHLDASPVAPEDRSRTRLPSVDDETVLNVLQKLLFLGGQRLSYRALDVEQIGSVYERLMGYRVERRDADSICLKPSSVWMSAEDLLSKPAAQRAKWIQEETGLAKAAAERLAKDVAAVRGEDLLAALAAHREKGTELARAGRLVIQPGQERRRTSSHYTPRSLTAPIVRRTLEPLLGAMGDRPSSERILNLKICDPAMGSGAFLVEACRFLGDQVVAAWTREGDTHAVGPTAQDAVLEARRLVAQRCLYGVDKNPFAVSLAKLSLWLVTLAKHLPFTFLDHALRHGDSLVGLSFKQITGFHWQPEAQVSFVEKKLGAVLDLAVKSRQRIHELASDSSPQAQLEKVREMRDAEETLRAVRLIGDLIVGAFFAHEKERDRENELGRRRDLVGLWLEQADAEAPTELLRMQADLRERLPVFHWMCEFPEVFWVKRPDPLDGDKEGADAWMDAFVGNPPFMGGGQVSGAFGDAYRDWLIAIHEGAHGNADLVAHFFRRTAALLGSNGTVGLIATNTIAQGDTRRSGLEYLASRQFTIFDAVRSMPWPGDAAVSVAVVALATGTAVPRNRRLDGEVVQHVNSWLRASSERLAAAPLASNDKLCSQGIAIRGPGFLIDAAERARLLEKRSNAERIFQYLGGEEVNSSPRQEGHRFAISFAGMTFEEASRWPDLLEIVEKRVRPERELLKSSPINDRLRVYWWRFWADRPEMAHALASLPRCLVTARVSKHLLLSFQPTDRVLSEQLFVFLLAGFSGFAVLQSRLHECWARLLSSSLEDRLRYAPSDCFENFPFPLQDPREASPTLETIGDALYAARAVYMIDTNQGLTQTYNQLKDPDCDAPRVLALRKLHEELDRAVLDAYGWMHIAVPPFCAKTDADRAALETFEDEVIDALFVLNAQRAEEERRTLPKAASKPTARTSRGKATARTTQLELGTIPKDSE